MKISRNSNNLGTGTIGDLLKRIKPEAVEEPKPQKKAEAPPQKKVELPEPAAEQSLNGHRVSGAHHNSGAMGSTGWQGSGDSMLNDMLKRLGKSQ